MAYKQLKLWFDIELAELISDKILSIEPSFRKDAFVKRISTELGDLELKDRIEKFADHLYAEFNFDFEKCVTTLLKILGPENHEEVGMFKKYYWIMPIAKLVEKYGKNHYKLSMKAIEEITKRNTGEYAIRPFIRDQPQRTLKQMNKWSKNKNKHVRRLASEGVRPRLPWATKLELFVENPEMILPILENLKTDQSKYVQKSVANCINDILKDNSTIGKELINQWLLEPQSKETNWIIKHAIRNLIKKEDKWALRTVRKVMRGHAKKNE